jgi:hypothetical protein
VPQLELHHAAGWHGRTCNRKTDAAGEGGATSQLPMLFPHRPADRIRVPSQSRQHARVLRRLQACPLDQGLDQVFGAFDGDSHAGSRGESFNSGRRLAGILPALPAGASPPATDPYQRVCGSPLRPRSARTRGCPCFSSKPRASCQRGGFLGRNYAGCLKKCRPKAPGPLLPFSAATGRANGCQREYNPS